MEYTNAQISEVMQRLGVDQSDIQRACSSSRACDALKSRTRRAYKKLALKLHPDKTNNDPDKAALFQLATEMVEEIKGIVPVTHPRREKWAAKFKGRISI